MLECMGCGGQIPAALYSRHTRTCAMFADTGPNLCTTTVTRDGGGSWAPYSKYAKPLPVPQLCGCPLESRDALAW